MTINFRRQGENGPMYNPERDYAYITPSLLVTAINNLETQDLPAGCTKEDVVGITSALAQAQRNFVNGAEPVASLRAALEKHGFYAFPETLQQALFAAIGEVICGAWFTAVREVSVVGEDSPASNDMARFSAAVREFAARANATKFADPDATAEKLQMRNDVLQTRINELGRQILLLQKELASAKKGPCLPSFTGILGDLLKKGS
jgi:hypothetical protein